MNIKGLAVDSDTREPSRNICARRFPGFTLIELMIVIGVVALLVALAMPGYQHFVRKANRGEAQQLLMNWANLQEIWRSSNPTYTADTNNVPAPSHTRYNFAISNVTATTYTLTATAQGPQALDKERGTACTPMTLDQSNTKVQAVCW